MDWRDRRVVILGAARQGTALAGYLARKGAEVVLSDLRAEEELGEAQAKLADLPVEWSLGGHPLSLLEGSDLVCPSGGVPLTVPLVVEAKERGIALSNDSQIFLEATPAKVIGVTGSAGKTTTTTLVGRIAEAAVAHSQGGGGSGRVWVGGNIGAPLIAVVDEMGAEDLAVMELSSFQLELMHNSPQVAAVLNITPNHLDRHETMEAYTAAKRRILDFQEASDTAVLGREDEDAWNLARVAKGRLYSFGRAPLRQDEQGTYVYGGAIWLRVEDEVVEVMPLSEIQLRGEHNLLNVLAACAIASAAGLPVEAMREGVKGFNGVAHRLEFVRRWGEADWYNDSIATAPERAMAAIRSFEEPLVLLAGGRDKKLPWQDFAGLVRHRVDHLVLFGEAAALIGEAVKEANNGGRPHSITVCSGLEEAVKVAAEVVEPGDVVLLAPGGTSFDEFADFEERGERFKKLVMGL